MFHLSRHEFDLIYYCGMGLVKLGALLIFFVPWIAVRLVLRGSCQRRSAELSQRFQFYARNTDWTLGATCLFCSGMLISNGLPGLGRHDRQVKPGIPRRMSRVGAAQLNTPKKLLR